MGAFVLSYFVKPQPPRAEIVSAREEIKSVDKIPPDPAFASRLMQGYGLALVLTQSEFSQRNADALESMRSWAKENFQRDSSFLHPVTLSPLEEPRQTVIDCLVFNLFSGPRYTLERAAGDFIHDRIQDYHQSKPYQSFRNNYYEVFGVNSESIRLLARYQQERAKRAVDVLLCAFYWLVVGIALAVAYLFWKPLEPVKGQRMLGYTWLALALFYLGLSWTENQAHIFVSACICAAMGFYLRRPIMVTRGEDKGLDFRLLNLSDRTIAITTWITFTLLAMQIITWIHTGNRYDPDPVTLFLQSFSGDLLHDPVRTKGNIVRLLGAAWLLIGLWTSRHLKPGATTNEQFSRELASLRGPVETPVTVSRPPQRKSRAGV